MGHAGIGRAAGVVMGTLIVCASWGCLEESDGSGLPAAEPEVLAAAGAAALDANSAVNVVAKGADPSGAKDSTGAIQAAIREAVGAGKIVFFPSGRYRIRRTLSIIVDGVGGGDSTSQTCVLMGSRADGGKPTLFVEDYYVDNNPSNFVSADATNALKYVVHFWSREKSYRDDVPDPWDSVYTPAREQANTAYNLKMINLRVAIGKGNAKAVAVRLRGAQGSGLQDVEIDLTAGGHTGLSGGCGSGGSHFGVKVVGGKVGLDFSEAQSAPTIAGMTLVDQSTAAIVYGGNQTLTAVGVDIRSSKTSGPLVRNEANTPYAMGQISLVDSRIDFTNGKLNNIAIGVNSGLYLRDVYVRGASTLAQRLNENGTTSTLLTTSLTGWARVSEFAHAEKTGTYLGNYYAQPVYLNGARQSGDFAAKVTGVSAPPATLCAQHLWPASFPALEYTMANAVNVLAYGATRDNAANDDSVGIQKAIDAASAGGKVVFIPAGVYHVAKTIRLHANTTLIGAARHLTILRAKAGGDFSAPTEAANPKPVIETPNAAASSTTIAFLRIEAGGDVDGRAYGLLWRCGGNALLRSVSFRNRYAASEPDMQKPFVQVTGFGGGRWYEFFNTSSDNEGPSYRHLLIQGATGPLRIYQCNPEHALPGGVLSNGDPKSLPNMEIAGSTYVAIYGLKCESNNPVLWVSNSDHVLVLGYGGNASALEGGALFRIQSTPNWMIANAMDYPRKTGTENHDFSGRAVDPATWNMIRESYGGTTFNTQKGDSAATPADRPVLYKRGAPAVQP